MNDEVLIRDLTAAEEGWDCAVGVLGDCYPYLPGTERGHAIRDLIRIEQRRREAFKASALSTPAPETQE